jgi:hypothetical protein
MFLKRRTQCRLFYKRATVEFCAWLRVYKSVLRRIQRKTLKHFVQRSRERPNLKKKWCIGPYAFVDYNLTLWPLQSRLQNIYHRQPYNEVHLKPTPVSTLSPSQELWILPLVHVPLHLVGELCAGAWVMYAVFTDSLGTILSCTKGGCWSGLYRSRG